MLRGVTEPPLILTYEGSTLLTARERFVSFRRPATQPTLATHGLRTAAF